jgi:hypothetical protein
MPKSDNSAPPAKAGAKPNGKAPDKPAAKAAPAKPRDDATLLEQLRRVAPEVFRILRAYRITQAYPSINDPLSGAVLPGGGDVAVSVSTNKDSIRHVLQVYLDDGSTKHGDEVELDFGGGNSTTSGVSLPTTQETTQDYFIRVTPDFGQASQVVVTVPAFIEVVLSRDVDPAATNPNYPTGQTIVFTATVTGGTGTIYYTWFVFGPTDTSAPFIVTTTTPTLTRTFSTAGTYKVRVDVADSSSPSPHHASDNNLPPFTVG